MRDSLTRELEDVVSEGGKMLLSAARAIVETCRTLVKEAIA